MSLPSAVGSRLGAKGSFGDPALEARARPSDEPGTGRRLVVAGPGVAAGAWLADVAGEHEREVGGAILDRGVEPVVDALALVDRDGLDRGDVVGELSDQFAGRFGDLRTVSRS